ncbi:MAG: SDR family oxidoreductase [Opitutae bacterium]|nr:SDR family oxidoreductase [Opitutae bacterium]
MDCIIHLAALSNDPIGNEFDSDTLDINHCSSVELAKQASNFGVRSFVFASSCSVYGLAEEGPRNEKSPTSPLTPYARSKVLTERDLLETDLGSMQRTCLRFATACGMSNRLRLDLVLNDFVAAAYSSNEINILSDGNPWRPLIDVKDMCRAMVWAISRDSSEENQFLSVNVGTNASNYQVRELAQAVARHIKNINISINNDAPKDNRSYKVDFSLLEKLAPETIQVSLDQSIQGLIAGLSRMEFKDNEFRSSDLIRLNAIRKARQSIFFKN